MLYNAARFAHKTFLLFADFSVGRIYFLTKKYITYLVLTTYLATKIATCVPTRIMTAKKQVNMSQLSKNCVKSTFL